MTTAAAARVLGYLGADPTVHARPDTPPPIVSLGDAGGPAAIAPEAELAARAAELAQLLADFEADPPALVARYREVFDDPSITEQDVRDQLKLWLYATREPDAFVQSVADAIVPLGAGVSPAGIANTIVSYLHHPPAPSAAQAEILARLAAKYPCVAALGELVNPNIRQYEIPDPFWISLLKAKLGEHAWPEHLDPFWQHTAADPFVYPSGTPAETRLALFSDFGTGYYHSWSIAAQIAARNYPFAFHCGDVYYAGTREQFATNFAAPLEPIFAAGTKLFCMPENHELYGRGTAYHAFLTENAARTPQRGSYFCVSFPDHLVVAIDVNWFGRQRYPEAPAFLRAWLADRLAEAGDRTVILLTGSAPYEYGSEVGRQLATDLTPFVANKVHLWFWGDDHYCALFDRRDGYYGSCIGWGGFPGKRQTRGKPSLVPALWVEDAARFPAWTDLRGDMTNNGWVDVQLHAGGGVTLTYVDWLGEVRCVAPFARAGAALALDQANLVKDLDARDAEPAAPRFL